MSFWIIYLLGVIAFYIETFLFFKYKKEYELTILILLFLIVASTGSWLSVIVSILVFWGDVVIYEKHE